MIKKIAMWTVYVLIVGLLVFGAVNRTSAKTDQGILFGNFEEAPGTRGRESGGVGSVEENSRYEETDHEDSIEDSDWVSFNGQVIAVGSEALEILTVSDGILEIEGRSWRFVQELGYVPAGGNEVVVRGFYENGEFEIATIQDLTADQVFKLRDEYGKPMWGGGRD
jgi:hypothetical protein